MNPDLKEAIEGLELQYSRDLESLENQLKTLDGESIEKRGAIIATKKKIETLTKDKEKLG